MPACHRCLVSASSSACRLGVLLGAALVVVAGCRRKPPVIDVGRVVLSMPRDLDDEPAERDAIRNEIAARLADEPYYRYVPKSRDAEYVLKVTAGPVVGVPGESTEARPVQITLRARSELPDYEAVGRGLPLASVKSSVMTGFDNAWEILGQERWLDVGDDARLIRALGHPETSLRDFAIQRIGQRKSVAAVERLCEILREEENQERVLKAVGALVAIGDDRAVEPMIELTHRRDPRFVIQVVFALGAIGGPTAEGYLVTLASGHPVPAVQDAAKDALGEMHERAGTKTGAATKESPSKTRP